MRQWRKYPEAMYSHLAVAERTDQSTGDAIVDETVCGLLLDRRNNFYTDCEGDPVTDNVCEQCHRLFRQEILSELGE